MRRYGWGGVEEGGFGLAQLVVLDEGLGDDDPVEAQGLGSQVFHAAVGATEPLDVRDLSQDLGEIAAAPGFLEAI